MKNVNKNVKCKKDGFTLIELLAVIIILGILMIIAIPSVTSYINNSRKSAYVNTAKELVSGARTFVNEGNVEMYDTGTTYYIDYGCVKTENTAKSPYGDFTNAYVVVTYDGNGYNYYWVSRDETGQGVKTIVKSDELDEDDIVSDIGIDEVQPTTTLGERTTVTLINSSCEKTEGTVSKHASETGETSFTLTYNNQDGTGCTTKTGNYMEEWGELCTPTRDDDYSFQGWYTQPNGQGNEITAAYKVNGHITIYAYWKNPTAADQILETALEANQLNQIPGTEIYIFKGGTTNPPANYVKFNNEDWRIIGIYRDQLKIIKIDSRGVPTSPTDLSSIAYRSTDTTTNEWLDSTLKEYLNGTYYERLNNTAKRMIETGEWNVGKVLNTDIASQAYTNAISLTDSAKIGLIATYEFLYASNRGEECLTTAGNIYSYSCGSAAYNWLKPSSMIWTLSPSNNGSDYVIRVFDNGSLYGGDITKSNQAIPVIYLKSSVKLVSGNGKSTSTAYILE